MVNDGSVKTYSLAGLILGLAGLEDVISDFRQATGQEGQLRGTYVLLRGKCSAALRGC